MDEDLSLGVSVDGVDESVAQLNAVQQAEKRLEDATKRAAAVMSTDNVNAFRKAAAEYDALKSAADRITRSQQQLAQSSGAVAAATRTSGVQIGQLGSTASLVAGTIGRLNGGMGQTAGVVAQALGSIQSLTTAGLGPVGIAIGVVSAAVTAATALWAAHTEKVEAAARAMDEMAAATARYREQQRLTNLAIQSESEAGASSSLTTVEGRRAATEARRRELEQTDAQRNAATLRRINDEAELAGLNQPRGGGGGDGVDESKLKEIQRLAAMQREAAANDAALMVEAKRREYDIAQEAEDRQLEILQKGLDERRAALERAAAEQIRTVDETNARNLTSVRNAMAKEVDARRKAAKTSEEVQKAVGDAHSLVSSIIQASAGSSERAQKKALQAEAAASAINSGIQAAVEVARAAASYPDVAGIVAHGTAAAAYVVAAAKAAIVAGGGGGAAGSGTPSAAAQAGGGGGGSSRPNSFDSPAPANDNARGEASRVIVQVGMPMGQPADIGRAARYALLASDRRSASRI